MDRSGWGSALTAVTLEVATLEVATLGVGILEAGTLAEVMVKGTAGAIIVTVR